MKKALLILFLCIGLAVNVTPSSGQRHARKVEYVLICNSSRSYAYHAYMCRGLAHCRHGISKVTKAEAIRMGYRPCKICY